MNIKVEATPIRKQIADGFINKKRTFKEYESIINLNWEFAHFLPLETCFNLSFEDAQEDP